LKQKQATRVFAFDDQYPWTAWTLLNQSRE